MSAMQMMAFASAPPKKPISQRIIAIRVTGTTVIRKSAAVHPKNVFSISSRRNVKGDVQNSMVTQSQSDTSRWHQSCIEARIKNANGITKERGMRGKAFDRSEPPSMEYPYDGDSFDMTHWLRLSFPDPCTVATRDFF